MKNKIIILFQPLFTAAVGLILVFTRFTGFTYIKTLKYLITEGMEFKCIVSCTRLDWSIYEDICYNILCYNIFLYDEYSVLLLLLLIENKKNMGEIESV